MLQEIKSFVHSRVDATINTAALRVQERGLKGTEELFQQLDLSSLQLTATEREFLLESFTAQALSGISEIPNEIQKKEDTSSLSEFLNSILVFMLHGQTTIFSKASLSLHISLGKKMDHDGYPEISAIQSNCPPSTEEFYPFQPYPIDSAKCRQLYQLSASMCKQYKEDLYLDRKFPQIVARLQGKIKSYSLYLRRQKVS